MTLEQMISAIERLQAVYDLMKDDQTDAKNHIRWAIGHLSKDIWIEAM
jgi:hypothetical protein